MRKNPVAGSLLLLAALGTALAAAQGPTYRTPQEVFEAARKAAQTENWKGVCATLTDETRDALAAALALTPQRLRAAAKLRGVKEQDFVPKLKPLEDAMARHGLTQERLNNLLAENSLLDPKDTIKLSVNQLLAPIVDRCAFIADMFKALKNVNENKAQQGPIAANAELKDVKIADDKAQGVIVTRMKGKETRAPIEFRKVGDSWKIELPLGAGKQPAKGKRAPAGK